MANVDVTLETDLPAAAILAAAVDFTARRPDLWPTIERSVYDVHALGAGWAEATEGSRFLGTVWARERYDWSAPGSVRATVVASNVFRPGSTWQLDARDADGRTTVTVRSCRRAAGLRGRMLGALLTVSGRAVLAGNLQRTLDVLAAETAATVGEPAR